MDVVLGWPASGALDKILKRRNPRDQSGHGHDDSEVSAIGERWQTIGQGRRWSKLDHWPLIRDLARTDEYHLRLDTQDGFLATPLPLSRLYVLDCAEEGSVCIEPVRGHAAIALVQTHTYRPGLVQRLGWAGEHLRQCARVAQRVRVFRYRRPWRLDRLEASLQSLLDHLQGNTF